MPEKRRIPRDQAAYAAGLLQFQMPPQEVTRWFLGGSWCRGAAMIGDLDMLVVTPSGTFREFVFPECFTAARGGDRIVNGHVTARTGLVMPCDFWACTPAQAGAMTMFITGPGPLNVSQRARAQLLGFKLSQDGLFDGAGGFIPAASEEEIYQLLGMEFMTPEERQRFAEPRPEEAGPVSSWQVPGSKEGTVYTVTRSGSFWRCDTKCQGFKYSRSHPRTCRHIRYVQEEILDEQPAARSR